MNLNYIIPVSFALAFLAGGIGVYQKISHSSSSEVWLTVTMILAIVFVVCALYEILNSRNLNRSEKFMWVFAFVFFNLIAGIIYIIIGRKKVISG